MSKKQYFNFTRAILEEEKQIEGPSPNELVQMLLKRQAELNSLLEITLAINKNSSASVLFEMLKIILRVNLKIGSMLLLVKEEDHFDCVSYFGKPDDSSVGIQRMCAQLIRLKSITALAEYEIPNLKKYDYYVPVRHNDVTLAFVLIGDFNAVPELLSHELSYIQTLLNIIMVALENKKLFRERVQRERLQRDIELAGEVQNMLVPLRLPKSKAYEIAATYLPHENIGGDYFDFIHLNDNEFLWCIADVSGKGVSAALLMANLQASLRAWTSVERDLGEVIRKLNTVVTNNTKGERFITLFLGRYNIISREMEYINAGHNAPVLIIGDQISFLKTGTTLLGVFDDLPFVHLGKQIIPEDSLIFNYTDGLIESFEEDAFVLEEELVGYIFKHSHQTAELINKGVLTDVRKSKGAKMNSDDITLLTLKIH